MGAPAAEVIAQAIQQLGEEGVGTFWGVFEIQRWLKLGQRTMCLWKPDSYVLAQWLPLVLGPRQALPAGCVRLFDVVCNDPEHGGAVMLVERGDLPASWPTAVVTEGVGIEHWMYQPADAKNFYVYPSYDERTENRLEVICGAIAPAVDLYLPGNAPNPAPTCTEIMVDDTDALLNYVLFRACLKQTDHGVRDRAAFFAQQYLIALGKGREAALMANPQRILNVQGEQV